MLLLRRIILIYPLALIAAVYLAWVVAALQLGHWPVLMVDDPRSLGPVFNTFRFLHSALFFAFLPYVAILSLLLTQAVLDAQKRLPLLRDCAVSFVFIAAFFLLIRFDPGKVFSWLAH